MAYPTFGARIPGLRLSDVAIRLTPQPWIHIDPCVTRCRTCDVDLDSTFPSTKKRSRNLPDGPIAIRILLDKGVLVTGTIRKMRCPSCRRVFVGQWSYLPCSPQIDPGSIRLVSEISPTPYLATPQAHSLFAVSTTLLQNARQILLTVSGSFNDIAKTVYLTSMELLGGGGVNAAFPWIRKLLPRTLTTYTLCAVLHFESVALFPWGFRPERFDSFLTTTVVPELRKFFYRTWVDGHSCGKCAGGVNVTIDGNAKAFRQTCQSIRGGLST